ncbi:alanine racemase [Streptococcus suis]|nr:alanine racemase [Streptococcus suis]
MNNLHEVLLREGTPSYIFDLSVLEERIRYLRKYLPANIELCYAIKANPFVVEQVSSLVERLEICSSGEYLICNSLQLPAHQFVISGVNKEKKFIEELLSSEEVCCYTAESIVQFELLVTSAYKNNKQINVLLRLTSGNQFGMDEKDIDTIIKKYRHDPLVKLKGLQYFSGTQKMSIKKLSREIAYIEEFLEMIKVKYAFDFEELEFGPGIPVAYFQNDNHDEMIFLNQFSEILNSIKFKGKIVLELGRSIVASCGTYYTKVIDIKCNNHENYAIVDGGIHQLVYYGQFMAMKKPIMYTLPERNGVNQEWNICGSLCTVNDILVKKAYLPNLEIGDTLIFCNTGAYSMTEGISLFLSRDLPKIFLFDGFNLQKVRNSIDTYILNTPIKIETGDK